MKIYVLFDSNGCHIPLYGDPHTCPVEHSPERLAKSVRNGQVVLKTTPVDDIIGLCDAIALACSKGDHPLAQTFRDRGIGFLPLWMRRRNLENMCTLALHGRRECLDQFVNLSDGDPRLFRAHPRGLLVHWVAGNVPVLGMLSLLQGLVSKNANILKASQDYAGLIPNLLESFKDVTYTNPQGKIISCQILMQSVCVVYVDRDDREAAIALSSLADVRVAWGGREAVETIVNLPRRFGTEDVIFGPKVSFIVIGAERLQDEAMARPLARAVARDASAFDQQGCNSPHTVFVERGGTVQPAEFAQLLAEAMAAITEQKPLQDVGAAEAMNVLELRAEYDMRGDAYYSKGMSWTVVYSDQDTGLAAPCYLRTLSVRPVNDVFEVVSFCSLNTQTVGLALDERLLELADAITARGVERCPTVGSMSLYESPWDGMFPIERMIRWVTTHGSD